MCTAFRCRNIIYETKTAVIVRIVMLECYFNIYVAFLSFTVNDILVKRLFSSIEIFNIFFNTTLVVKRFDNRFFLAVIVQYDFNSFGQKCHFTKTAL